MCSSLRPPTSLTQTYLFFHVTPKPYISPSATAACQLRRKIVIFRNDCGPAVYNNFTGFGPASGTTPVKTTILALARLHVWTDFTIDRLCKNSLAEIDVRKTVPTLSGSAFSQPPVSLKKLSVCLHGTATLKSSNLTPKTDLSTFAENSSSTCSDAPHASCCFLPSRRGFRP